MESRSVAVFLVVLMMGSILASGCTGDTAGSQPPASVVTVTTRKPVTPAVTTTMPLPAVTTAATTVPPVVTPPWRPGDITQGEGSVLISGDVVGLKSPVGNFIDEIRFTVVKAPRVEPVTFEIPNTQIIFTRYGQQFGTNYQILSRRNGNGDVLLEEGEAFDVSVPIQNPYEIFPGQKFTMAIKIPQTQVLLSTSAPPVLTKEPMVLASAPSR
jgi:hypothetical protein